jgi:hypothetical protein
VSWLRELGMVLIWLAVVAGVGSFLSWGHAVLASIFSGIWFGIAMILMLRPPAVPGMVRHDTEDDDATVTRTDVFPILPARLRLRISLFVACATCFAISCWLIWLR